MIADTLIHEIDLRVNKLVIESLTSLFQSNEDWQCYSSSVNVLIRTYVSAVGLYVYYKLKLRNSKSVFNVCQRSIIDNYLIYRDRKNELREQLKALNIDYKKFHKSHY